jgi:hypothetical protein
VHENIHEKGDSRQVSHVLQQGKPDEERNQVGEHDGTPRRSPRNPSEKKKAARPKQVFETFDRCPKNRRRFFDDPPTPKTVEEPIEDQPQDEVAEDPMGDPGIDEDSPIRLRGWMTLAAFLNKLWMGMLFEEITSAGSPWPPPPIPRDGVELKIFFSSISRRKKGLFSSLRARNRVGSFSTGQSASSRKVIL